MWKGAAEQLGWEWGEGRVPKPPLEDVIKAAVGVETEGYTHQLYFSYPAQGGTEAIPRAMARGVRGIRTGFRVKSIWRDRGGWCVSDGRAEQRYERLVATMPIHELAHAVDGVPLDIVAAGDSLRYHTPITVAMGYAEQETPDYTAVDLPAPDIRLHRISFPKDFSPPNT